MKKPKPMTGLKLPSNPAPSTADGLFAAVSRLNTNGPLNLKGKKPRKKRK